MKKKQVVILCLFILFGLGLFTLLHGQGQNFPNGGGGNSSSGDYTVNGNLLFSPTATYYLGGPDALHTPLKAFIGNGSTGQVLVAPIQDGTTSQAMGVLTAQNGYFIVKAEAPFGSAFEPGFQFIGNNSGTHGQILGLFGGGFNNVASDATSSFLLADISSNVETDYLYVGHNQGIGFEQHFNQGSWVGGTGVASQANATAGTCAMSAGTSCTFSLVTAFTATPICIATARGANITGGAVACSVSGTTVTITAASSNSNTWGALLIGNPN